MDSLSLLRLLVLLLSAGYLHSQSVASQAEDRISSCIIGDSYSACYDDAFTAQKTSTTQNLYYNAFMKMRKSFDFDSSVGDRPMESCKWSTIRNLTLTIPGESRNVSIILIRTYTEQSAGNLIGFFYEVLSFAVAHGILVGRLEPLNDHYHLGKIGRLESHLPRLFIPHHLSSNAMTLTKCDTLPEWPWESPKSNTWNTIKALNNISDHMMTSYAKANIPEKVYTSNLSDSVGIHFRCGDNLDHPSYGVIGLKTYGEIFSEFRRHLNTKTGKVIVYTDVNRHGKNGHICWSLLGELANAISKQWLPGINVEIHSTAFSHSFTMLHFSKITVCSVSTFCFYSTFGSKLSYQPLGPLLNGYPTINGIGADRNKKIFRPVLLRPSMFPKLSETGFIDLVINS